MLVQVEKYERGPIGQAIRAIFIAFEVGMLLWCVAFLTGAYDPAPPLQSDFRNPMAYTMGMMAQSDTRQGFLPGLLVVWIVGTIVLYLLLRVTRRKVFMTEERP